MLKTKLLATGIFLDNEYFNKYLTLVLYKKITLYATVLLKQFATAYYYNPYLQ